jgi:hypothetical protein
VATLINDDTKGLASAVSLGLILILSSDGLRRKYPGKPQFVSIFQFQKFIGSSFKKLFA